MINNPISCHLITWGDHFEQGLQEVEEIGFHACELFSQCRDYLQQRLCATL